MFERPKSGDLAVLVHVDFRHAVTSSSNLHEFAELAKAAGATVVNTIQIARDRPDPKFFIGSGKATEIAEYIAADEVDLVLINHDLSPSQERNLEKLFKCRVLSRTGLILDIFASRARTFEGKLQVELAQLQHMSTRLVRGWTHLERQKGGIGLRGPGETQLETDRRLVRHRIDVIEERLLQVRQQRAQNRHARMRKVTPTVALVGYTNAGKSTLFNALTKATVFVADQLFATLDPTLRAMELSGIGTVVLADTVGFIENLPHGLVEAFHATLEETVLADLLLHVVDVSDEKSYAHIDAVNAVLLDIGASDVPQLIVFNKADCLSTTSVEKNQTMINSDGQVEKIWVSALKEWGLDRLKQVIRDRLSFDIIQGMITLPVEKAAFRAALYEQKAVEKETIDETGNYCLTIRLPKAHWLILCHAHKVNDAKVETQVEIGVNKNGLE